MKNPLVIAFGSQVSGRATSASDFDFGVVAEAPLSLSDRTDIAGKLAKDRSINEDKIDLVDISTASPILKFEIAKYGRLITGNTFDFIRFKVRAFKEYQDTAKFRRLREQVLMQKHV